MKKAAVPSILVAALLLGLGVIAEAQQAAKVPRIAYFSAGSASSQASRLEVFRQGLRDLGYAEGKDIVIEQRYADVPVSHRPRPSLSDRPALAGRRPTHTKDRSPALRPRAT